MKTTRPIFKDESTLVLHTPRLLLRPCRPTDLDAYHQMRSDPITMRESIAGVVDGTRKKSLEFLERFLPPKNLETFSFSVFLPVANATSQSHDGSASSTTAGDDSSSESLRFIGNIGIHKLQVPEAGYMFMREEWGKGYATEAMRAVLDAYWGLERREVEVEDDWPELRPMQTVDGEGRVREGLRAMIEAQNHGSRRVLEKSGFRLVEGREFCPEPDHRGPARLIWYYIERPVG